MDAPQLKTALPGPKAKALIERDGQVVSPSYTRDYPFVIARGEGATVEDVDGNIFLDCAAGIAVNSTGHAHPVVVAAIIDQVQKFLHMSGTDFYYEPQVRLGEELAATAPMPAPVRTFFANSGTEANEAAIKLARYHTGALRHHRLPRQLPRPHDGIAVAHLEPGDPAPRVRSDGAGHLPRALRQLLPLSGQRHARHVRRRMPRLPREPGADAPGLARRRRGGAGRADPGRGRLRGAAGELPSAAARVDDPARDAADGRRGAVRDGPHRQDVGDRAFRRRARRGDGGQGHRLGPAARGDHRQVGGDELAARRARQHVWRQPGVVRVGASPPSACCATRW